MKKRAEQVAEDVRAVTRLVHRLQSEAKAYADARDNSYRCEQLALAAAELSEFMRAIRDRKAIDG